MLRVVGLSGGLGLITGVKKNLKKIPRAVAHHSPHIRPPLHDVDDSAEHAGIVVWGCQSNSIYFSDCLRDSDSNTKYGRVINVFNLHDSSVTTLYKHDRAGPIWISPNFV